MNKMIKGLTIGLMGLSAFAGDHNINVTGRLDYVSFDADSIDSTTSNYEKFQANNLYTTFSGKIDENLSYKVTGNWTKAGTAKADGLSEMIDSATLTHKLGKTFDITFGKQFVNYGTFEEDYNSADVYHYSLAGNGTTGLAVPFYETGVALGASFADQRVVVQVLNSDQPTVADATTTGAQPAQRKLMTGVTYFGSLMGGAITPMASYHVRPTSDANDGKDAGETYMAAGARFKFGSSYFEVDYNSFEGEKTNALKDVEVTSIVAKVGHTVDKCHFALKMISDELKNDKTETYTGKSYVVAYEHNVNDMMRYHAAYVMSNTDYKAAATRDTDTKKIVLGVKFNVDLM